MDEGEAPVVDLDAARREDAGPAPLSPDYSGEMGEAFRKYDRTLIRWLAQKFGDLDTARDIAQSAYLRIWRYSETREITNLRALIFQTAANLAANEFRARKRRRTVSFDPTAPEPYEAVDFARCEKLSPETATIAREEVSILLAAINALPEPTRRAFVLSRFEGKTYREIATALGVSESSIEKYIISALKSLRAASATPAAGGKLIPFSRTSARRRPT